MGTWGTGILDNDLAEDLKEQWVDYLSEGYAPDEPLTFNRQKLKFMLYLSNDPLH